MSTSLTKTEVCAERLHRLLWDNRQFVRTTAELPAARRTLSTWDDRRFWTAWDELVARGHVDESPSGRLLIRPRPEWTGC